MFNKVRNYFEKREAEKIRFAEMNGCDLFQSTDLYKKLRIEADVYCNMYNKFLNMESLEDEIIEKTERYQKKWIDAEGELEKERLKFQANYVIQDKKMRELEGKIDTRYYAILLGLIIGSFVVNKR